MNIFDALFGRSNAPPMSVGEMVGGAAADPSQLMDQLANRKRTAAVTNYMLQDSPFSQIVQAPVRGAMGVADVLTGQKPYEAVYPDGSVHTAPQFIGDVADVAGSIGVGGVGAAANRPGSSLGIFGGRMARNAPLDDLARAEAMEQAGQNADDIWRSTGWGRGADGDWRFEIDDSRAVTQRWITPGSEFEGTAGDVLKHRDLYNQYPDIPSIHATHGAIKGQGGSYGPIPEAGIPESIAIGDVNARSTALHELQHATQKREGFARGGSPNDPDLMRRAQELRAAAEDELPRLQGELNDWTTNWLGARNEWDNQFARMDAKKEWAKANPEKAAALERAYNNIELRGARSVYPRLAGEVEARNVQKRADWTAAQRRETPPWATEDVPRAQQIVRKR